MKKSQKKITLIAFSLIMILVISVVIVLAAKPEWAGPAPNKEKEHKPKKKAPAAPWKRVNNPHIKPHTFKVFNQEEGCRYINIGKKIKKFCRNLPPEATLPTGLEGLQ
jgi:energy-converting hydrogenase Eha subunit F